MYQRIAVILSNLLALRVDILLTGNNVHY